MFPNLDTLGSLGPHYADATYNKNQAAFPRHLSGILLPTQDINTTPIECLRRWGQEHISFFLSWEGKGADLPEKKKHQLAESSKP